MPENEDKSGELADQAALAETSAQTSPATAEQEQHQPDQPETTIDVRSTEEYRQLEDKYLRLAAEFENYKKRNARESMRMIEAITDEFSRELLEILDDFKRALAHQNSDPAALREGTLLIHDKFLEFLRRHGITEMQCVGQMFDPRCHEAVMQVETADVDEGVIVEELQKGYMVNDRILRPAAVVVARKKQQSPEGQQ